MGGKHIHLARGKILHQCNASILRHIAGMGAWGHPPGIPRSGERMTLTVPTQCCGAVGHDPQPHEPPHCNLVPLHLPLAFIISN